MKTYYAHDSTYIADDVTVGSGTKIWINVQIREQAVIGKNCIISKDVYIDHAVTIGNGVKIQNGVSIYSGVTVEDEVFIGPNAAFTNDYFPRANNPDWEITPTRICKGASIGANSTIVCGHTVGEYAMVGAGSVVTKNIMPYSLVVGNPARKIGRVCQCGQRADNGVCGKCGFTLPVEKK